MIGCCQKQEGILFIVSRIVGNMKWETKCWPFCHRRGNWLISKEENVIDHNKCGTCFCCAPRHLKLMWNHCVGQDAVCSLSQKLIRLRLRRVVSHSSSIFVAVDSLWKWRNEGQVWIIYPAIPRTLESCSSLWKKFFRAATTGGCCRICTQWIQIPIVFTRNSSDGERLPSTRFVMQSCKQRQVSYLVCLLWNRTSRETDCWSGEEQILCGCGLALGLSSVSVSS